MAHLNSQVAFAVASLIPCVVEVQYASRIGLDEEAPARGDVRWIFVDDDCAIVVDFINGGNVRILFSHLKSQFVDAGLVFVANHHHIGDVLLCPNTLSEGEEGEENE